MMRSSWMTSRAVLRSFVPCFLTQLTALGSVFCSMPLGLIAGRAATPFNRAISARSSPTVCCNAAFSASRRSVKASRSPRDRPEREIFSGADTPGKIGARQARRNLTLLHTCPAFCPSYNWNSVFQRFRRWAKGGVFEKIFDTLSADADFEYVIVDGTIVRVHQHGTGAKGGPRIRPSGVRAVA